MEVLLFTDLRVASSRNDYGERRAVSGYASTADRGYGMQ